MMNEIHAFRQQTILVACCLAILPIAALNAQPRFGREHGVYSKGFPMKINSSDAQAEVRYTTDGSEPTASSTLYKSALNIQTTVVLRAAEFKNGERTSDITTATYIIPSEVLKQPNNPAGYPSTWGKYTTMNGTAVADYEMDPEMTSDTKLANNIVQGLSSLPILSIVTDKENLFNKTKDEKTGGIYIYTGTSDDNGRGWERPASVELIGGSEQHNLTVDCALKLHGGQGRVPEKNPKHSFRLTFKSEYGPSKLEYPVYGDHNVDEFNSLIARTFYNYSWLHTDESQRTRAQYTRDLWARKTQIRMGNPTSDGLYVNLFLNGLYWGLYNLTERIDDSYCKYHFGGKKADYDVVKREDYLEAAEGDLTCWNTLLSLSERASDNQYYEMIIGERPINSDSDPEVLLDVDNLIDYMLINQYMGNLDWDHHNWIAFRNREHHTQGFRFICWDSENTFSSESNNVLSVNNRECPTYIFNNLMKNRTFLHRYIDRAYKHLSPGGVLSEDKAVELWDSLYNVISLAIYDEAARWGDYRRDVHPYTSKGQLYKVDTHYKTERERLLTSFFPKRTQYLIQLLRTRGWYSTITPPTFLVNGEVATSDTLTWDDELKFGSNYAVYYTTDGTVPATWVTSANGAGSATSIIYNRGNVMENLNGHEGWVTIRAIARNTSLWSPTVDRKFYITSGTGIASIPVSADSLGKDDIIYDLSGRRVTRPTTGIYIVNGRKVVIR